MSILNRTKLPLNVSYRLAQAYAFIIAIILFILSYIFGRDGLFLWFNTNLGAFADTFFSYFTYLAEGWIWIPYLLVLVLLLKKRCCIYFDQFFKFYDSDPSAQKCILAKCESTHSEWYSNYSNSYSSRCRSTYLQ